MSMQVRPGTRADREAVLALHRAAVLAGGPTAYDDEQVAAWATRGDPSDYPVDDPTREFVVCERDGDVAAFGDLDREAGEVVAVYVHPDHARGGVGSAVLDRLETAAREAGHDEATLVASRNAVGFYERRGYERVVVETHETTGDVALECVRMRTDLDAQGR